MVDVDPTTSITDLRVAIKFLTLEGCESMDIHCIMLVMYCDMSVKAYGGEVSENV